MGGWGGKLKISWWYDENMMICHRDAHTCASIWWGDREGQQRSQLCGAAVQRLLIRYVRRYDRCSWQRHRNIIGLTATLVVIRDSWFDAWKQSNRWRATDTTSNYSGNSSSPSIHSSIHPFIHPSADTHRLTALFAPITYRPRRAAIHYRPVWPVRQLDD